MDKIQETLQNARKAIEKHCIECKAYCCRKGYLVLTPEQVDTTMQNQTEHFKKLGLLKPMSDGNFSFYMNETGCPSLKNNLCSIHTNPGRSDTCKEFPIHVQYNLIHSSMRCPYRDKLYPFISELIQLGCEFKEEP